MIQDLAKRRKTKVTVNVDMTQKLKAYFHKTGLYKLQRLTNRQQRQVIQDVGCSSIQLVEFVLYGVVSKSKED